MVYLSSDMSVSYMSAPSEHDQASVQCRIQGQASSWHMVFMGKQCHASTFSAAAAGMPFAHTLCASMQADVM